MKPILLAGLLLAAAASPSLAETTTPDGETKPDWIFILGAGATYRPIVEGDSRYEARPFPAVDIRYRDWFFISTQRGIGLDLIQDPYQVWRAGPVVTYRPPRYDGKTPMLYGMGDLSATVEAGAYVEYAPDPRGDWFPFHARLEARQGIGGHQGLLVEGGISYRDEITEDLILNIGPGTTWASHTYNQAYFGVTEAQSTGSGYAQYEADGGFKDASFGAALSWQVLPYLGVSTFAQYKRLLGPAADSPMIRTNGSPNQVTVGMSVTLRVGFDLW